jgi:hypothetical protein
MDLKSACDNSLHIRASVTSRREAAPIRAVKPASILDDDQVRIETITDSADLGTGRISVTSAAGIVEPAAELKEPAHYEASTDIQNEDNPDTEPDMSLEHDILPIRPGSSCSKDNYVPWLGARWTWGRISRIIAIMFSLSLLLLLLCVVLDYRFFVKNDLWIEGFIVPLQVIQGYIITMSASFVSVWLPVLFLSTAIEGVHMAAASSGESSWAAKLLARQYTRIIGKVGALGMAVFISWAVVDYTVIGFPYSWPALTMPQSFSKCDARVSPDQASLFTPEIYHNQFDRSELFLLDNDQNYRIIVNKVNVTLYDNIRANQTLCAHGFQANADLYGLGVRFGVYMQWISSIMTNHFLPTDTTVLQRVYLIFCLAICVTTVILSITHACIFGVEVELLYWLYWGGFVCVFASSPSSIRLGQTPKWIGIDWIMVVLFSMHTAMIYHATWFMWYAYDQVFSRMPCGTFHFFFAKLSDPSETFLRMRNSFILLSMPFSGTFVPGLPFIMILLLAEIKHSVHTSALFQLVFKAPTQSGFEALQNQATSSDRPTWRLRNSSVYLRSRRLYYGIRKYCGFPEHGHGGIRLITPVDIEYRRFVAPASNKARTRKLSPIQILSLVLSHPRMCILHPVDCSHRAASEMEQHQRRIFPCFYRATYPLHHRTCQLYVHGLQISTARKCKTSCSRGFILTLKQVQQRRNDRRRRQTLLQTESETEAGFELENLANTFTDAIAHAFVQPDADFLNNNGALPIIEPYQ